MSLAVGSSPKAISGQSFYVLQAPNELGPFATHGYDLAFYSGFPVFLDTRGQQLKNIGVVGASQSAVAGYNYVQAGLYRALSE